MTFTPIDEMEVYVLEDMSDEALKSLKVAFWDRFDQEHLTFDNIADAIADRLDDVHPDRPTSIDVYGYRPIKIPPTDVEVFLDQFIETYDEEYGDPDGEAYEPSKELRELAEQFVKRFDEEYKPWAHTAEVRMVVRDVKAWVQEHIPEWAKDWE